MPAHKMDADEEALFRSYPYALYFVQSPSTVSHANDDSTFHSPLRSENFVLNNNTQTNPNQDATRIALSRYSSSRGSNNSFMHEKIKLPYDLQSHGTTENRIINIVDDRAVDQDDCGDDGDGDDWDEDEEGYFGKKDGWWKYLSFGTSTSLVWFCLQLSWRIIVSLGIALLVFYIATKPPPPKMSIKMAGIREFGLGEGVDASGVTTKVLTFNCSMNLLIDNKSKLFGLHIHPPLLEISLGKLPLAITYGPKLYAYNDGSTQFNLYVGTKNKPMYGAGRYMQDMLESREGLPLAVHVSLRSSFKVVWNLIKPKFHHNAECLLVLKGAYDNKHRTQAYNSSCIITT